MDTAHISLQMVAVTLEVGKMIEWKETNAQNTSSRVATITGGSLNLTAPMATEKRLMLQLGHDSRVTLKMDSPVAVAS